MILHEDQGLFQTSIRAAASHFGIPDFLIEKDYWLTSVLKKLSQSSYRDLFVFKGGTSLSKAFGLIQRFSEDVDLALLAQGLTGNQVKSRIDKVSKELTQHLVEIKLEGTTRKWSRFRRTAHQYPILTPGPAQAQITAYLVLELNAFGNPSPYLLTSIRSMLAEFLLAQDENSLIAQYALEPFCIQVLQPERTLGEKILALVRASYHADDPIAQLQNKIRHAYDLHVLMTSPLLQDFVTSDRLFETLKAVQTDDADSREFQGEWNQRPLADALIFRDTDSLWKPLAQTYSGSFRPLVYGPLPEMTAVRSSLRMLRERLQAFDASPLA